MGRTFPASPARRTAARRRLPRGPKRTALRRQAARPVPKTGHPFGLDQRALGARRLGRRAATAGATRLALGGSPRRCLATPQAARRSWTVANSTLVALDVDFDQLVGWSGFLVRARSWWAGGNDLSDAGRIDNLFNAASTYTPNGLYLGQLYAEQHLFDEQLVLQIGRLASGNNFASLPVAADYVSAAFNAVPFSLPTNTLPFTSPAASQWGAVATAAPLAEIELTAGVYNADRRSSNPAAPTASTSAWTSSAASW